VGSRSSFAGACGNEDAVNGDRDGAAPADAGPATHEEDGSAHVDGTAGAGGGGALEDATFLDGPAMADGSDANLDGSSQGDAPSHMCLANVTYGSTTLGDQAAVAACGPAGMLGVCAGDGGGDASDPDLLTSAASLDSSAASLTDYFVLELYKGYSSFGTKIAPGRYPITGDELDYETCGVCPLIRADCSYDGVCQQIFYATGGTVTITSVYPNLAFTVENLTFAEVAIDPGTRASTPLSGGCVSAIDSGSFDAFVFVM
jgi:hypothetical protein